MEIGLGKDGTFDCSGLIINSMSKIFGCNPESWERELRHTRQMVRAMDELSQDAPLLEQVDEQAIGDLIFSRQLVGGNWRVTHVGILSGFNEAGKPIRLESGNGTSCVVEREVGDTHGLRFSTERYVFSSSMLASLAVAHMAGIEPASISEV